MKKLLFVASLLLGFLLLSGVSSQNSRAATCQLTGTSVSKQVVAVGETFIITVVGKDCADQSVTASIKGRAGLGPFMIKEVSLKFPATSAANASTTATTSISAANITNRTSDISAFVEAAISGSAPVSSQDFTIKPAVAGSCQLSLAQWKWNFKNQPIVGSPVKLVVNGAGCPGYKVQLDIYEQDTGLGDDHLPSPLNATFNTAGTEAISDWKVDGSWDDDNIGSYEFYFKAAAGQSSVQSKILNDRSGIPLRSEGGCINCNNVVNIQPDPCMCADGTSQTRPTLGLCNTVCKDHIGDSHGGGQTGPGGPIAGTASKTYVYELINPLKGGPNDLFDLINIVSKWILNLSIPLAVVLILYAGFLMLTAGAVPAKFQEGKKILTYVMLGLAIIFIGRGFITLIYSIIELGGDPAAPATQNNTTPGQTQLKPVGGSCTRATSCGSGLICNNGMCQNPAGNPVNGPCNVDQNCAQGLSCDTSAGALQLQDNSSVGTCVANP